MPRSEAPDAPEALLQRFDEALSQGPMAMELCVVGGAVIALAFAAHPPSRRPALLFLDGETVNATRRTAAEEGRVALDRLEAAARTLSLRTADDGPSTFEGARLRVFAAPPDYVLAMRCAALAFVPEPGVEDDIRYLLRYLGLRDASDATSLVGRYLNARQRPADLEERLAYLMT